MVFFNDPIPVPDAPERAVRMAVAMRDRVAALTAQVAPRGLRAGPRPRHRARLRDARRDRLRGPLGLRGARDGDQPGGAALRRGARRARSSSRPRSSRRSTSSWTAEPLGRFLSRASSARSPSSASARPAASALARARAADVRGGREHVGAAPPPAGCGASRARRSRGRARIPRPRAAPGTAVLLPIDTRSARIRKAAWRVSSPVAEGRPSLGQRHGCQTKRGSPHEAHARKRDPRVGSWSNVPRLRGAAGRHALVRTRVSTRLAGRHGRVMGSAPVPPPLRAVKGARGVPACGMVGLHGAA